LSEALIVPDFFDPMPIIPRSSGDAPFPFPLVLSFYLSLHTMYKLDRAAFKIQTFREADLSVCYDKQSAVAERLRRSFYLTAQCYRFDILNPPKLDRMHFEMKKVK
jgi:hypothetical protein